MKISISNIFACCSISNKMIIQYNREKAVEYALKYALSYNPNYYHFGGIGGDCTNYISQCLLAGGGKMNFDKFKGWYYVDSNNRAPSWTSVIHLQNFLLSKNRIGPFAKICELSEIELGDLIQLRQNPTRFNHTLIVTKIENGEIFVCAHSNDAKNKKLKDYFYKDMLPIHIQGIYI